MKRLPVFFVLLCTFWLGPRQQVLQGQVYSPATEYHDPVQRVFPVEAARVLAWWTEHGATNLVEVAYDVTTKADQTTVWEIRWLDASGKTAKSKTVSYPAELLKAGPDFYRSVFKQLWMADWRQPTPFDRVETVEGFWRGAAQMGLSRETSLERALELVQGSAKVSDRQWIPELAGLLIHASLPAYAEVVSLDRVVLARGAAWLAFAEMLDNTNLDSLWAPVLFQAGRERVAARLWQAAVPANPPATTSQQEGWNLWVRKPFSREVFLFAAASTNLPMALPMLAYDVRVKNTGPTLAELTPQLVDKPDDLAEWHNYGPLYAMSTSVGGGHLLNGAWAFYSRLAWLRLLSSYRAATNDFHDYTKALADAQKAVPKTPVPEQDRDPSLGGFRECAPLLRLAHAEGVGKLATTPVATARDLLNYGWEMAGWQMGSRYHFVNKSWGVPELGEAIYKTVAAEVEGYVPFFKKEAEAHLPSYPASLKRLEQVEGLAHLAGFNPPPTDTDGATLAGARLFVKRCWLRPGDLEWQVRVLYSGGAAPDIPELIEAMQSEGGSLAAAEALAYLSSLGPDGLRKVPKAAELKFSVAETLPEPTTVKVRAVFDRKFRDLDNFARGQEYERLYWQNPDSGLEGRVIFNYIVGAGYKSARRFYEQARPNIRDPIAFASISGQDLFLCGFLFKDAKLRAEALEDSNCGSYIDMEMNIWEAAIGDKPDQIEAGAKDLVERYEQEQGVDSPGRRLLKFMPLLPALRDPRHASRREALEFFGRDGGWTTLRYIWIETYKIPTADAIVLMGGRENNAFSQLVIAYLEKDQAKTLDALNLLHRPDAKNDQQVLGSGLYQRLHTTVRPREDVDLKPPGAMSIRQAVRQKLKAEGRLKE